MDSADSASPAAGRPGVGAPGTGTGAGVGAGAAAGAATGAPSPAPSPVPARAPSRAQSRASTASDLADPTAGSSVRVIARFRPLNAAERAAGEPLVVSFPSGTQCVLAANETSYDFGFDRVFDADALQADIFDYAVRDSVHDVLSGYNGTVLAYGQTGAGKSYTMMGTGGPQSADAGAIPRMVELMFDTIARADSTSEFSVTVAYMEVYNERVKDLLSPKNDNLPVHEVTTPSGAGTTGGGTGGGGAPSRRGGFYVKGLKETPVATAADVYDVLARGGRHRATASTNMNAESSRSHSIIRLSVTHKDRTAGELRRGMLFLVDLAGSEKVAKTGAVGQVLEEAKSINKSLSTLGMVINALTDPKAGHVPYRDSKLTRILQHSLGGNSRTSLIINCSPAAVHARETLSTLRFGTRAKAVRNRATINSEFDQAAAALRARVNLLEGELLRWRAGGAVPQAEWIELTAAPTTAMTAALALAHASGSSAGPAAVARRPSSALSHYGWRRSRVLPGLDDEAPSGRVTPAGRHDDVADTSIASSVASSDLSLSAGHCIDAEREREWERERAAAREREAALRAQLAQALHGQAAVTELRAELQRKTEAVESAKAELKQMRQLTAQELLNERVKLLQSNMQRLLQIRAELLEENTALRQQERMHEQLLRSGRTREADITAQVHELQRQCEEKEAALRAMLSPLGVRLEAASRGSPLASM